MLIRPLLPSDASQLIDTFNLAFNEYPVKVQLTADRLAEKIRIENLQWAYSFAAFEGGQMLGFVLHGKDDYQGIPSLYNGGTEVIPEARGRQLTKLLYAEGMPLLRASGAEQIVLEVLEQNVPALTTYTSVGFHTTRKLVACVGAVSLQEAVEQNQFLKLTEVASKDWGKLSYLLSYQPSFQHRLTSIQRSTGYIALAVQGEDMEYCAYAFVNPASGRVAQFAYTTEQNAHLLLQAMKLRVNQALAFINLDSQHSPLISLLSEAGFQPKLGQYEMLLPI